MTSGVTALIFLGVNGTTPVEVLVDRAREAIALDTVERLLQVPACQRIIVATNSPTLLRTLRDYPVVLAPDGARFHFGERLRDLVLEHRVRHALYLGGGSGPLLTTADLARLCERLLASENTVIANNFFSADFVAFTPGEAIARLSPPTLDNDLAFSLVRQGGLQYQPLPRTPATLLDVDTPTDLLVLALHPGTGRHTRRYLATLDLDLSRLRAAMACLTDPQSEVVIAGRLGPHLWAQLDQDLACRKRVFSEERGMRASGRADRGEVRSLVGFLLETLGPTAFFERLAALGQAAFLDSRVLFAHLGRPASRADRFHSDLLQAEAVQDPVVRDLTAAARAAPIPVVLGGHSLVAGGIWALAEAAWLARDRAAASVGERA